MSTILKTNDATPTNPISDLHAVSKEDITISIFPPASGNASKRAIGIAKTFTFGLSKPKTPIEVIGQRNPAGFARSPEDRTFTMNEIHTFERIEDLSYFMNSNEPFKIQITVVDKADNTGRPLAGAKAKVIQLEGVEFENVNSSIDSAGSEYSFDFSGKFRSGTITGDINASYDPFTWIADTQSSLPV